MDEQDNLTFGFNRRLLKANCVLMACMTPVVVALPVMELFGAVYMRATGMPGWGITCGLFSVLVLTPLAICWVKYLVRLVRLMRNESPAIVISREGVRYTAGWYDFGTLEWDDLERIFLWTLARPLFRFGKFRGPVLRRIPLLVLKPKAWRDLLMRVPWFERWLAWSDLRAFGGCIVVMERSLAVPGTDLMKDLNKYYLANVVTDHRPKT